MKAVMYGAGNIGRGFIGQRLYLSGYRTTFVDVNDAVVDCINREKRYPIFVTRGTEYVPEWVENVDAINGKDADAVVRAISECDVLCTAVGVPVLPRVAPIIARALEERLDTCRPLNILICENMIASNEYLHDLVEPLIPEEKRAAFEEQVGFVCASVGRTVPPTPAALAEKYSLAVCAEPYSELPVDATGFRPIGCEYPPIRGLIPFSPFDFYIERKLFIHNMGHALLAYYGYRKGQKFIFEAAYDGEIKYVLTRALLESARALCKRHGASLDGTLAFIEDLMVRFENVLLFDSFERVGRDPVRKLSEGDRLVGAFKMVREEGGVPAHIAMGIAAGYLFDMPSDPAAVEITSFVQEQGLSAALAKYSGITDADEVAMIKTFYDLFVEKAPFERFLQALSAMQSTPMH